MKKLMIGLCGLSLLLVAGSALPEGGTGPIVLVVDLSRVLKEADESRAEIAKLEAESSKRKEEFNKQLAQLELQRKELQEKTALSERDDKWYDQLEKAAETEGRLKAQALRFNAGINDRIARKMDQLLKQAREVANAIRKERGAIMVFASKMGDIKFENDRELEAEQIYRRVLCAEPSADITDEVLARMNEWWKQNRPQ